MTFTSEPSVDIIEACKDKEDNEEKDEPIQDEQGMFGKPIGVCPC